MVATKASRLVQVGGQKVCDRAIGEFHSISEQHSYRGVCRFVERRESSAKLKSVDEGVMARHGGRCWLRCQQGTRDEGRGMRDEGRGSRQQHGVDPIDVKAESKAQASLDAGRDPKTMTAIWALL